MQIDDFVRCLLEQGIAHSSDGQFTLDLAAQSLKMLQHQTQEPALWLLKGVQAAVASGAPRVSTRLTRSTFSIHFVPPVEAGEARIEENAPVWCLHLRLALLSALCLRPEGLSLRSAGLTLFELGTASCQSKEGVCLQLRRRSRPWWSFADPELAAVHHDLSRRAAFSPIPVILDGKLINAPFPEGLVAPALPTWGEGAFAYHWLAERQWPCHSGSFFSLACPLGRAGQNLWVGERCVWKGSPVSGGPNIPPVSAYQYLESESQVSQTTLPQTQLEASRLAISILPGVTKLVDTSKVLGLALEVAGVNRILVYSKIFYLEDAAVKLSSVLTRYPTNKMELRTLACQRWLGVSAQASEGGRLFYMKDGIMLNAVRNVGQFPGTIALIADSLVATDLSQLNVVVDERVRADQEWLKTEESRLIDSSRAGIFTFSEGERMLLPISVRERWRTILGKDRRG